MLRKPALDSAAWITWRNADFTDRGGVVFVFLPVSLFEIFPPVI